VAGQVDVEVEHIVIDGGSQDGTVEVVKKFGDDIAVFLSEPDKGIYDAMNKGLKIARGDIIGTLNGDDFYAHRNVLAKVASVLADSSCASCYGDLVYVERNNPQKTVRRWRSGPYDYRKFYWGWMPPHPTFFARRAVYEKYGCFNLQLGTAADYELMLRFLVKHRIAAQYIPDVLVKMRMGGRSNVSLRSRIDANKNDRLAWHVNDLKPYPWTLTLKPLSKIGQFIFRGK